jgi:biopolymer transport protein ExbB/TolQ
MALVQDRKRDYVLTGVAVVLVIAVTVFAIAQLHSSALIRIDETVSASATGDGESSVAELAEVARIDPVGFNLATYMHAHYSEIVLVIYFVLGALAVAVVVRFLVFFITSMDRKRFYPDDVSLQFFTDGKLKTWKDFSESVMAQNHLKSRFWRILKDSVLVTDASGRYDHLYLHLRNRIDRVTDYLNETALYESIATASPAAGFFGTLVGLLFIFSNSQGGMAGLSESPAFSVGMKVAIITSLWGLFNLGLAIVCGYFTRRIAEQIHQQMVVRGVIVCEVAESISVPQVMPESERKAAKETVSV